ncbi:MAG: molybdopterin dinucleotide binding domain-containing protein, partial [Pseudomonadota bacterium]
RFYPVNVLILDQANPAFLGADPTAFQAALRKIPLVVSLSGVADDSSFLADLVLPESSNFEAPVDVLNPPTLPYPLFGKSKAILKKPFFDTKPAADIILGLAEALGDKVKEAMPFENYEDMVEKSVADLFEASKAGTGQVAGFKKSFKDAKSEDFAKALDKGMFWYNPAPVKDLSQAFKTPSGKFEFFSQTLQSELYGFISEYKAGQEAALADLGITAKGDQVFLPHFEPYLPALPKLAQAQFPLLLVPVEQFKLVTSHLGNAPYLTKLLEDITLKEDRLVVEINPQTARRLNLSEGDQVVLETEKGGLTVRVHLFAGAQPEVVYAPLGLGHNGYDLYLRGKGSNPMEIIDPVIDPLSGQALWWGARAKLTKV